jgi:cytochrome c oxidase cbb3-type subunit IV
MDINDLRTISTVLAFGAFVSLVVWVYSSKRKNVFDEIGKLPFDDDEPTAPGGRSGQQHN